MTAESWVNHAGRVHVKYLKPIYPHEAADRQAMGMMVRRRMLEALKSCPQDLDEELSSSTSLVHMGVVLATIGGTALSVKALLTTVMTPMQFAVGSAGITVGLYVYYVYLINLFSASPKNKSSLASHDDKKSGDVISAFLQGDVVSCVHVFFRLMHGAWHVPCAIHYG
jgi:hypothetical protein